MIRTHTITLLCDSNPQPTSWTEASYQLSCTSLITIICGSFENID